MDIYFGLRSDLIDDITKRAKLCYAFLKIKWLTNPEVAILDYEKFKDIEETSNIDDSLYSINYTKLKIPTFQEFYNQYIKQQGVCYCLAGIDRADSRRVSLCTLNEQDKDMEECAFVVFHQEEEQRIIDKFFKTLDDEYQKISVLTL